MEAEEIKAFCIFCGRTDQEVAFSREHVIPQSIGGGLFIDGFVCVGCNSGLGSDVDCEILKLPDILRAYEALGLPHDREGILRRHFDITGDLAGNELKQGRSSPEGFAFPPQRMPDGSMITAERGYFDHLRKMVHRDQRLRDAGLTREEIDEKLRELQARYEAAQPGSVIEAPDLGRTLLKRREPLTVNVTPRQAANLNPVIAKIAYEFAFFVGGAEFFADENSRVRHLLREAIETRRLPPGVFVMRVTPQIEVFQPVHLIRLEFPDYITLLRVGFFGHIEYTLTAPPLSEGYGDNLRHQLGIENLIGIQYQEQLDHRSKLFLGVLESGGMVRLH